MTVMMIFLIPNKVTSVLIENAESQTTLWK